MRNNQKGRGGGGRGRGRRNPRPKPSNPNANRERGLCSALGTHMFTYDQKGSADHARTTLEKIVLHIGSIHGQDISTELDTRQPVVFEEPKHSDEVKKLHEEKEQKRRKRHDRPQAARKGKVAALQAAVDAGGKDAAEAAVPSAEPLTEMEEDEDKMATPPPIKLKGNEKIAHDNLWKNHRERTARHGFLIDPWPVHR